MIHLFYIKKLGLQEKVCRRLIFSVFGGVVGGLEISLQICNLLKIVLIYDDYEMVNTHIFEAGSQETNQGKRDSDLYVKNVMQDLNLILEQSESTFDGNKILQDIVNQSYSQIPMNISVKEYEKTAKLFDDVLDLPYDMRTPFMGTKEFHGKEKDFGLVGKDRKEGDKDSKHYLHYNCFLECERADKFDTIPQEMRKLIYQLRKIYPTAAATVSKVIKSLECAYPQLFSKFHTPDGKLPYHYFRVLKYIPGDVKNNFSAKGHYDRGTLTFALRESEPGLMIGPKEGDITEVVHQEGQALFFLGRSFPEFMVDDDILKQFIDKKIILPTDPDFEEIKEQLVRGYIEKTGLTPGRHEVKQKSVNARYAIVLFVDMQRDETVNFEKAHTPIR